MSSTSFENFNNQIVNNQIAENSVYIADTSFLLHSIDPNNENRLKAIANSIRLNMTKKKIALAYNVTIRNELHHRIRSVLVESYLETNKNQIKTEIFQLLDRDTNPDKCKVLARKGYGHLIATALGKDGCEIQKLVDKATANCTYISGFEKKVLKEGETEPGMQRKDLNWTQVRKLMQEYALDSSDAMILNMGLQDKQIRGILTADSDFRYVKATDFQIITDDRFLDERAFPIGLDWKSNLK